MCFGCFSDSEYRYIQTTNDSINSEIQQHRVQYSEEIRILLLGLSGSGKSTIFKQIALLHGGGFSTENRLAYKQSIICNIIKSMQKILNTMEQMDIPLTNSDNEIHQNYILGITNVNEQQELTRQMRLALRELWRDNGVQTCYGRSREYQLIESAKYFFDEVERIGFKNYTPSLKDVIHDQTETTGITEAKFRMNGQLYRLLDVGGQQSERKKWIHCFEDVTAVIFMAAISDYNKTMMYDSTKSRIHESLALFDSICNSRWFVNTSMILFLNKTDLFESQLVKNPMSEYLPEYTGSNDFESTSQYVKDMYIKLNRNPNRLIYTHFTCATDTNQIKMIVDSVTDTLVRINMSDSNMVI